MDVMIGKLRESMERGDDAVEDILSHGGGHEAVPRLGGTARIAPRRRRDADTEGLRPEAAGAALNAGSVLAALPPAFDLAVHTVDLGEHVFGPGLPLSGLTRCQHRSPCMVSLGWHRACAV